MTIKDDQPAWGTENYLKGRWTHRVEYFDYDGGFAHRPGQSCVDHRTKTWLEANGLDGIEHDQLRIVPLGDEYYLVEHADLDVVRHCKFLERHGLRCEPNYVLFADAPGDGVADVSGNPIYGNPIYGNPIYGNPIYGNPIYGNPIYGNGPFGSPTHARPDWGTPLYMSPLYADRHHAPFYRETGRVATGARPALGDNFTPSAPIGSDEHPPKVIVLDTGLAGDFRPDYLIDLTVDDNDVDVPDSDVDIALDPVAGHGTFIAGIIRQLVPGIAITSKKVLSSFGDGDVAHIHKTIHDLLGHVDEYTIVNMSFGGYSIEDMRCLAHIVDLVHQQGGVVVASAGNDGIGRPSYPASLPGVVGVGGLGQNGPAAFTNWGPWLRTCAPAVDLTSCFYVNPTSTASGQQYPLESPQPAWPGMPEDRNRFEGWARWTGTSFAAPIVVAAIAREMRRDDAHLTACEAEKLVVDAPDLMRIPNLGAVVNLCPPLPPRSS